jgi:hypothetical protein
VPGVLVQLVAFAREDQEFRRNAQRIERALQQIGFANVDD